MKATFTILSLLLLMTVAHGSRIKDITTPEGIRQNQLVGYGIVTGLAGTGDSSLDITNKSIANALKEFGINTSEVSSKNVAAVMITAEIGPFAKNGSRLDVTVSSIGSAKTLQGGILLQTPLYGADGVVYAVAQGSTAVGGFLGGSDTNSVQQNHPTVSRIADGAIVEREIPVELVSEGSINLLLANPDFSTSVRIAEAINRHFPASSMATNPASVNVIVPDQYTAQITNFIAAVGSIDVLPDSKAKVIINERTGTIVATSEVRVSKVAVSHGSLTITISTTPEVSQPNALSETGTTETINQEQVNVTEIQGGFSVVDDFPTIERLTSALNALGVSTRELMSILQAIKSAGALQAELILN